MGAAAIQVIVTDLERRGKGVPDDPIRRVRQYWSMEGDLLAEWDECQHEAIRKSVARCLTLMDSANLVKNQEQCEIANELKRLAKLLGLNQS